MEDDEGLVYSGVSSNFCMCCCLLGAAGDPGVSGLAAGPGDRQQESDHTGQTHGVPLGGCRQRSLRVGLLQQLDHQDPPEPKVRQVCQTPPERDDLTCTRLSTCSQKNFVAIVDLPEGEHQYKFCVDGHWLLDPDGVSQM